MKTKTKQIENHLTEHKHITSWDAIKLYGATRLSAIIFNLRDREWNIKTEMITEIDRNGNSCTFAKYILLENE